MPRQAVHIGPEKLIASAVPQLLVGQYHTESSALHDAQFVGILRPWQGFESSVRATHQSHSWRSETLALKMMTRDPYASGNLIVGDKHGLLTRFHKYFGDVLNSIFQSHSIGMRFADFKCAGSGHKNTPDTIMMDDNYEVKVAGELKTPWVRQHRLEGFFHKPILLRKVLAQLIQYMQHADCVYGFLSNYEETIFLRQRQDEQGLWRIEYSPVIRSSETYNKYGRGNLPAVSVRQCFFYVGCEALAQRAANNTTPDWVVTRE
ncbi:hypothetical protein PDE_06574 [Penicillium oxalicum 114-2]|uniref:Uncharacterized protein n=1 Tax=Penicillium oxalicum (strain 114-2 / CGMCC 5302) TaxID=933388 RepID=S7ZMN5_PENO1|nr:hypothetical protein PDE_06574 [Penicillium oxalicum 114-2]